MHNLSFGFSKSKVNAITFLFQDRKERLSPPRQPESERPICALMPISASWRLVNLHEFVRTTSDAEPLSRLEHMLPVEALDARDEVGAVIVARID